MVLFSVIIIKLREKDCNKISFQIFLNPYKILRIMDYSVFVKRRIESWKIL